MVILGAGYAGLTAARQLTRRLGRTDADITLVNRSPHFVERVRMHQVAAGELRKQHRLDEVLAGTGVDVVVAEVVEIDLGRRIVRLSDGGSVAREVGYELLLFALGSEAARDAVPGVRQHALSVADAASAAQVAARLGVLAPGRSVAVVGGGLTGIEAVTELAETHPHLRFTQISSRPVGEWLTSRARRRVERALSRLHVQSWEGCVVDEVRDGSIDLQDRRQDFDVVIWAAGFAPSPLAAEAGLRVNRLGRIAVDRELRSLSHPEVFAIGDAAAALGRYGEESRMSCQTALPMGYAAARGIARVVQGLEPKPVTIRYVWQNISLGRSDAVTQFTTVDDRPVRWVMTGRVSSAFKELITRSAVWTAIGGPYRHRT